MGSQHRWPCWLFWQPAISILLVVIKFRSVLFCSTTDYCARQDIKGFVSYSEFQRTLIRRPFRPYKLQLNDTYDEANTCGIVRLFLSNFRLTSDANTRNFYASGFRLNHWHCTTWCYTTSPNGLGWNEDYKVFLNRAIGTVCQVDMFAWLERR